MKSRRRSALKDDLVVLGLMLSFVCLLGIVCVMMFKYVAFVPDAFDSSPLSWRNPMDRSGDDSSPSASQLRKMTPRERYEFEENAARQNR